MRPRLTSLSLRRNLLLKPRLGKRRCSGIWPPSKPLIRPPERAVWPLPPRPPVLPLPEPMPRPMRVRSLRDPGRSAIWLSFIASSLALDHADEVLDLREHPARHRRIRQFARAPDLVQPKPDQGLALCVMAPHRAAGLFDLDGLGVRHDRPQSAVASLSTPVRRACNVETLMLRRCATDRGESCTFSASKVARTMLYGLDE